MEEKQQIILANQDGGTVPGAAPTFFVILKQPGNGKTDQGILVTNRDACALASSVSSPGKSKGKICLPADCTVGGITVTLDNNSMWNEFYHRSTEMILTKQGRRMFPYCRYWITGLDSNMKYILVMDISPVDNHRYKWNGRWWEPSGKAEPHVLGRVFIHPESPSTGHYWMHQPVSFYKLKLTNNTLDQEGHIILHSMHRYLPRLHLVPAEKATEVIQLNGPGVHTFTFPQTEFFAVTAYQNIQITQLKIDYNPFAKGFRDDGLNSKPQRDGKQKNSSDQEGNSVPSSPGQRVRLTEGEGSEMQLTDLDPLSRGQETSGKGLEKPSLNIKRDFLGFMDIDSALDEVPQLKQEVSESLGNSFEDGSHVTSPLSPNENFNVVIKEEPLDDYEYELGECPEGVTVKQEETDEETDVYSNSDDDPILEKQLKRHNKADNLEADHPSSKWQPNSPSGVAKAKMFKLDAGKMPVVYLEPCAVTKSTVKVSELPDNMLCTSRKDRSSLLTELDYLPAYIENSNETGFCLGRESENDLGRHSPDIRVVQKYPSLKEAQWKYPDISDIVNTEKLLDGSKSSVEDSFLGKEDLGRKKTMLKISAAPRTVNANQNAPPNVPGKRGRPRKLKLSKAGRPPKNTGRSLTSTKNTPTGPGSTFPDVKPDLEDVDGVLFVSFESKEALDIHAVDGTSEESCSLQASAANDPGCRARISQLEKELIEDLKALRHKQVIHPGLQEVGLKLNSVDPTMSIDLKYLGVQLPLAPATSFPFWNLTGANPASPDAGFPFVSRTGKTNDFTKIKGWRGKFHSASASRNEGGNSEGPLKNRSAFCSDKLDEYLENEGKLMETSMGFSSNAPTSPVVYQLPTKSTSYVRTLDSVLKKQSTISPSTSYSLKPHSVPSVSRKAKSQNKQATFSGRTKSSYKSILPYPVSPKQKHTHMIPGDKITKNSSGTTSENRVNNLIVPTLDENTFPKQISLRQAHQQQQQQQQQQQGSRPPGLSKSQVKLMDLEDCALWEGKPRTYITEERADVSLTTLLTAQASLKTKPIHTIIRKRAPPCNNDFCRLGCVCSSLALEKRQPAHCRRPDCMFGCTCLKRKVVLVKGGSKTKHFQKKSAHRDPVFYDNLGEEQKEEEEGVKEEEEQLKEKKKRKKLEYTICETEPEQPVRHYPLWVKVEGEVDPEPVYIPTPSVIEPMKPLLLPQPEVLSTTVKGKLLTGIKPARAYTPKPNPVIREEDKDPVYLYFESMMTCARVRVYERKKEEERQPSPSPSPSFQQQGSCHSSPENCSVKEPASEQQPLKPLTCDLEDDSDKSQEKSWKSSCNEGESASTSYVHQRSPGGPTKLIEIISDCNWEEDRNKILSILSQHINSNMPQSLKVASNAKVAASRKPRTLLPSTSNSKMASSSGTTTNRPGKNLKAFVPAKRPIVVVTTAASSSMVTTPTSSLSSVPVILSGIDGSPPVSQRPENAPQIPVAPPQVSPNTVKRPGPRLLLIPVQQGSPTLRPVPNTQLQGHRMVLQPVRSPSGMNLFRHPNGQIVQLLPLHQLRGSNNQPNLQPVMFRNPGSVMGIRLPTPSKPSETPPSSASPSAFSVVNPVIQAVGSSPAMNVITQAPSLLSSGPNFVSQSGTLTLRISPPEPQSFTSKTASETKITYSSGGQPVGTASLIPLQSGSFALLQLPGQKPVPSSILQHVASLQMKRESQNADQKDETSFLKREQETKKVLQSGGEAVEPETNIIIKQNSGAAVSEETLNDSLEDGGDHLDEESLIEEGPSAVKPSEHVYSTGSHTGEDYKDVEKEYGIRNHNSSKEKLTVLEVKTISGRASNIQSVNNVQLKKLGDVKVEQQKGLDNPEEKSNEFPIISKEESKVEFSGSRVVEQQSNPKPEAKEKDCGESLEKDSIKERWRKHLKGPLAQKYVRTSQEGKNETNEQLIKETKTCKENSDVFQQEHSISDLLGKSGTSENARILKTECDSWSRISSPTTFSIVPRRAAKGSRRDGHFQGHLLLSGEQIKPKQEKTGGSSSTDFTVLELEEDDEEDENEKTDDSIDEIVDVVSDYQSEEVDDVEKNNCIEYIEDDDEQVDIETVEELPEEINVTHMKSTAVHTEILKQPCRMPVSADEKATERSRKAAQVPLKLKPDCWSEKLQKEAEAFAYYRRTHTANERRRRGEMRDLFEKLKITLGLLHSSKVSKSLILTRAFSEIQGLTDQADKLIGQKNLLTRKRNILIRKVSSLSGKTEEVVLKKLEYIYAKQQALEAQKRKKKMGSDEFAVSPRTSKQQEGAPASSVDLGQMFINNRKGKPLILSRKKDQATENTSPSNTPHTSANIVMTPQGQLLTLKGPLFSGPVVTVSPALLETDLKPQVASSAVAQSENDDLFMMPRIVNVTSLATEGGLVDMSGSKYPHEVPDGKPPDHLKNTVRSEDNSCEDLGRISSRGNHRDVRMALGTAQVYLSHKDSGCPQMVDVSSMQEAQEFLPKKISGDTRGSQHKWKESESRRERLKTKESPFHKLKMKDLKDSSIEMELRKVASAIEEAALDPSELLTSMEDEDDTDETLTSLLNEIAFLNQQLNDDSVSLAELPSSLDTEFPGDARRAFISKLPPGNRATFQVGHLGTGLKELPDVQGESDSVSPLLLHLEDDDFSESEKQLAEPASEPDVLKIVIDSEIKDSLVPQRKPGDEGKNASGIPAEPESVSSPPILHMKGGLENSSADTLWRPMPKLAPLGLKVANPSSDTEGQSLKVMPCLAPVAAKVGSVGHKMNLTGNDQECRESKVMPTLAPVVAKLGNTGASPSSAGK
ncbi:MAX gene-associated protein isoform X14 [Ovis aries]|uniref:MAX gene-associated protein isoform X14 n=1 Tax=Ovis aries TaxID=9940 RepID=UPI00295271A5|nr:MAX gene-associated protein isoform X14 [Ovis aries]XP_060275076.1 MAX gene-associated protein isoform X14 [Ovis aries]